ncbi:MAG: NADH-quinone oxidoreductase subunit L [Candidatus Omnitrophota bacterium]
MNYIFAIILSAFLGAFLVLFFPRRIKPFASVFMLSLTCFFSILAGFVLAKKGNLVFERYISEWFNILFYADGTAIFMSIVSSFVAFLISLYSLEYMRDYKNSGDFYFWMTLFVGSMMGLIFSANLVLMYCFWEITAICSWKLIGFYKKEEDLRAADRAFLTTFMGASLLLIGIVLIYLTYNSTDILFLRGKMLTNSIAFLLLMGIISKSAQLPLQTWLPEAGVAPTPVTALLHAAVLVKIGVYAFARLFNLTFIVSPLFLKTTIFIAVTTIIVGAGSALVENNIKRILAYSTISQLGYILLALAINTELSLKIALFYILAHSLAKAGLFLCAGIVEHKSGTKDINQLGGLVKTMPWVATAFLLSAFSIMGIPPFLGFWPKLMVILTMFNTGHVIGGVLAVVGAVFTVLYLLRVFGRVFLGELKINVREVKNSPMVLVVLAFGILSLGLGLLFKIPFNLLDSVF